MTTLIETIASIGVSALFSLGLIFIIKRTQMIKKTAIMMSTTITMMLNNIEIKKMRKEKARKEAKMSKKTETMKESKPELQKTKKEAKAETKPAEKPQELPLAYKNFPSQKSKQREILYIVVNNIQLRKQQFSLSDILSEIIAIYPETDNQRGEIIEELDEWVQEDPRIIKTSSVNNKTFYQMKGGIA